jgi:hypothetical protein
MDSGGAANLRGMTIASLKNCPPNQTPHSTTEQVKSAPATFLLTSAPPFEYSSLPRGLLRPVMRERRGESLAARKIFPSPRAAESSRSFR